MIMDSLRNLFLLALLMSWGLQTAQSQHPAIAPQWIESFWDASWIQHPTAPAREYGVYHFRKAFDLSAAPAQFVVHVSADNRYRLLVNGQEVSIGPARGDMQHWRFETVDIAPQLRAGKNVIAATVWNFGLDGPVAQVSWQTAFILQGNGDAEKIVNTGAPWKVMQNPAYSPESESVRKLRTYIVVGPGDIVRGADYPWGWEQADFPDTDWPAARSLYSGQGYGMGTDGNWLLMPREIPMMEARAIRFAAVRRTEGIEVPPGFLGGKAPLQVPAGTKARILLDQAELTTAYPELRVSGGQDAHIRLSYAEALFDAAGNKGNRDDVEDKELRGYVDIFYPDGGENRLFRPLWFRTWRYVELAVETKDAPLTIHSLTGEFTGYPFEEKARFSSDQPWLAEVWETGWRTARLCAGETYYDCPYYEQLQYVGDTRIQALISLYVSGDDRLVRRAIMDYDHSRIPEGLTQSRYPCQKLQVIPPYSLFWVAMIHDYWMHREDTEFVRALLPGIRSVLFWYEQRLNEQGLLGKTKWWHFVDWTDEWAWDPEVRIGGVPAQDADGNSSILSLHYAYTLRYAEELHRALGETHYADTYRQQRDAALSAVRERCWDAQRGLFADTPGGGVFSQHANLFAILGDALPAAEQPAMLRKLLDEPGLIEATFYFKFYLFRALVKTGMADEYLPQLQPWRDMLDLGLSTFAEKPDPTRSDCHAWSASPNYDLLATVAGISPAAPGFRTVRIAPALGELKQVSAEMPHPAGTIRVDFERKGTRIQARVALPEGVSGVLEWAGESRKLAPGAQEVVMGR